MHSDRLRDLFPHSHHRIQRRHRLLKNHGHLRSAQGAHSFVWKLQQIVRRTVSIREQEFAANMRLWGKQTHQG
jgi:hypothetical protein